MLRCLEIAVADSGALLERGRGQEGDLLSLHQVCRVRAARFCVAESQAGRICAAYKRYRQCAHAVGSFARQELGHPINSVIESALAGGLSAVACDGALVLFFVRRLLA